MTSPLDLSGKALTALVTWVVRHRYLVVVAALVLSGIGLRFGVVNLGINTDTANMIARDLPWRQAFDNYRDLFPVRDRNLVVVVEADDARLAQERAGDLADRMRAEPELFPSVFLAGDGAFFERNGLLYLPLEELEQLSDRLVAAQPLLGQLAATPNGAGVLEVLAAAAESSPDSAGNDAVETLQLAVAQVLESADGGELRQLDWGALLAAGAEPARRQLIVVRPALDFTRVRPARAAIERIREFAVEMNGSADESASVRLTGTIALEHEELDSVVRSASFAGALALAMVIAVLYWALRSVRLLLVSVFVLLVGLIATASMAAITVGHLNLLSVAFAVLYVGLGVDFILHISLRVKESLAEGAGINDAVIDTMRNIGASLVICTLTTAAGFFAFAPSHLFEGVSELGVIAGTGMFVSFVVSVTLLPALLAIAYRRRHRESDVRVAVHLTAFALRRARLVVAVSFALILLAAISLPYVYFDSNPVNLRDPNAESVVVLGELAQDSDAGMLTMVALSRDSSVLATYANRFADLDAVREVRGIESIVPAQQDEKLFVLEDLSFVMGSGVPDVSYEPAGSDVLRGAAVRLYELLSVDAGASPAATRLRDQLERFAEQPRAGGEATLTAFDRALLGNLPEQLARLDQALLAESFSADDLPTELRERWVAADGTQLLEIVPQENVRDNAAAAAFVAAVRSVDPQATGLPVVYNEAGGVIVASFRQAMTLAVIAIAAILLVFLRSIRDCMIVLIPIFCAAILTAGSTVWIGIPFNFANIIALPLLMGVGVDNAIHMLHRLRSNASVEDTTGSTSLAVFASGLTTIASFGNLAFSTHLGMATMGTLLTIGMIVMMAATLVFLPALLRSGLRT